MGIRDDMEMLKLMQQQSAMRQGDPGQMSQIPPWEMQQPLPLQMQQVEGMQQHPEMQNRSPLEAGSRAAVDAAKHSLRLNDDENRRALGRALMGMMSGIGKSQASGYGYGQGLAGNLAQINAGFEPALQAYDSERDRIMKLNHQLSVEQKKEAMEAKREEHEMKKMSHEMDMAHKNLAINQGYLGLEKQKIEHEKALEDELTKAGASIPLGRLSAHPSMHNRAMDNIKSQIEQGDAAIPGLHAIDTIERVLKDDPDITKHWGTIALAVQRKDPGYVNQVLANKVSEKTRTNAEMLAKSLSILGTSKFKGIPPKGLTAFAEKMLIEGSPSIGMSAKAILKMTPQERKYFSHKLESRDAVYDNLEKGIYHIPKPMKYEAEQEEVESPLSQLTPEQAEARKAQLRAQLGQ